MRSLRYCTFQISSELLHCIWSEKVLAVGLLSLLQKMTTGILTAFIIIIPLCLSIYLFYMIFVFFFC